jgi:ABC-2 type transport system permease protein
VTDTLVDTRPPSVFWSLYGLFLRTQVTRTRLISLLALSAAGVLMGWAIGLPRVRNHLVTGTNFVDTFGLAFLVPLVCLVFASSMFGDLNDDSTLVYLWLRPLSRLKLVLAAALASFSVCFPIAVPPLVVATILTGAGSDLVIATVVAATVLTVAYVCAFVALGLRVRRPLVWGLLYIFIWEGFIARGSYTAAKFAIRSYGSSILYDATGVRLVLANFDRTWSIVVPLLIAIVAVAFATRRLHRQDVA